ncbi:GAF domain-containing sensor histidine kinase [Ruania zhangjianzhongii]|uniref:GAF domain-containing sensor histidine kinase n=1 Tax=Ruania zhangjianzhongii TaxID=2603206 RepID=UPI0011CB4E12|nr:GAF domain-containing sensor histidine kinase [Ruania zhangjianzhongii]
MSAPVLEAILTVTSHLDLREALRNLVRASSDLTGASYAAITIIDPSGDVEMFVDTEGNPEPVSTAGRGAYLEVPVLLREATYGNLTLTGRDSPFLAEQADQVRMLAAAAAIAVQNARLYDEARTRERWLAVGQEITTMLLSGTDVEESLGLIAVRMRQVARADTAVIVLPGVGSDWVIEFADGDPVGDLIGIVMPPHGRAMAVLADGRGIIVDSFARARPLRVPEFGRYGPSLYAPLVAADRKLGVFILLRNKDAPEFTENELTIAESIARQAALALTLAESRQAADLASLLAERGRIARDLHDLAIQQLFATELQLRSAAQATADPQAEQNFESALAGVDQAVAQIRSIVRTLRTDAQESPLLVRLQREESLSRIGLGFAPTLSIDGPLAEDPQLEERLGSDLADDVVAVVREGFANAARHAGATAVHAAVQLEVDRLTVQVSDNGTGVDPHRSRRSGLANLAARAEAYNGTCELVAGEVGSVLTWTAERR